MKKLTESILLITALTLTSGKGMALEALSDAELSDVSGQSTYNFLFDNIKFEGRAIDGVAEAGSYNTIGADGSGLRRQNYRFVADHIGTAASPLTTSLLTTDASVNSISEGEVTRNGTNLGEQGFLHIGLPELAAWKNVDIQYDAVYLNPSENDPNNRNIAAGGTPSEHLDFGKVTIDNLAVAGSIDIGGIPEGYKIESVIVDDGSRGAGSRQGFLLNVDIDELSIDQWLFESEQADGVFDAERDMVLKDFRLTNLHLKSATIETTEQGYRIAYSNPQAFTQDEGLLIKSGGGFPDVNHAAYDANFPKANLTLSTQLPHGQMSESRIRGMTIDHLIFNVRN